MLLFLLEYKTSIICHNVNTQNVKIARRDRSHIRLSFTPVWNPWKPFTYWYCSSEENSFREFYTQNIERWFLSVYIKKKKKKIPWRVCDHETGLSGWKCSFFPISYIYISRSTLTYRALYYGKIVTQASYIYIYNLSQASFRRHSLHNSINTVPQVKSKTIYFSSLTYISAVLNGLHQGEWPLQASHTIITW